MGTEWALATIKGLRPRLLAALQNEQKDGNEDAIQKKVQDALGISGRQSVQG